MTQDNRRRTINSRGEIVPTPSGPSRWDTPRVRACTHQDCPNPARVLRAADAHPTQVPKAHNCCGSH